ncbi:hypothetical protein EPUS_04315 [Endocarpon pusillum Z07020]|uniref:Methyltransferase domain-containing protein n=1 Tax=Endocarpon pusillum (strain Z07020 / HMAS-L-300199) TaxID=1263415 RepID=U1GUU9_ENDPU|nr:uncharacterized protein EPUS_04315 [Endocarpon pusillum Z07020]ERF76238.1 hypothetical protein EPUS_04315 [Endocarpon pusillum Z07020]
MSTQYDAIGASYNNMSKLPGAGLVYLCIQQTVEPLIKHGDVKVLDLACGTGRFTHALRAWGAKSVLGVDISPAMINAACGAGIRDANIKFEVGDCAQPDVRYADAPFDLVLSCWLLNYAASGAEMADMFRHAAGNLRAGGSMLAMTPCASEDPVRHIEEAAKVRPKAMGEVHLENIGAVEEGIRIRVWAGTEPEIVQFDSYHLRKSVYEKAARDRGFKGRLEWTDCRIPKLARERGEYDEEWEKFAKIPHSSILVVTKE